MKKLAATLIALVGFGFAANPFSLAGNGNGTAAPLPDDSLYWYNAIDSDAIGLTNGGVIYWAVRFTIDASTAGTVTESGVYIHEAISNTGNFNLSHGTASAPGTADYSWTFDPSAGAGWYTDNGSNVSYAVGDELWADVNINTSAGQYPASVDDGPAVMDYGDWVSLDGTSWSNLADYGLSYNWDIYVMVATDVNESAKASAPELKLNTVNTGQVVAHITVPEAGNVSLKVYDMTGKLVSVVKDGYVDAGSYAVLVNGLRAGSYIVNFTTGEGSVSRNLIVAR